LSSGGDAMIYQVVDREQQLNFVGGQAFGATKIEVAETREYTRPELAAFTGETDLDTPAEKAKRLAAGLFG